MTLYMPIRITITDGRRRGPSRAATATADAAIASATLTFGGCQLLGP
jgi:hypothetical protein